MAWTNALDVEGAELVARDPADPDAVWFDPVALYPDYISIDAGVVTVLAFGTNILATPPPPTILEFGVRFPAGYTADNARISVSDDTQLTPTQDGSTIALQGVIVEEGGADAAVADMSASLSVVIISDITTPTEVGEITGIAGQPILSARATITPP